MIETLGDIAQMARNPKQGRTPGDNTFNCTWAAVALDAYTKVVGGDDNEVGTQISDLLGDLMHLADAAGVDFYAELSSAETNYEAEVSGE
ncbi:hypothetical protein PBI_KALPINE_81 [Mycobacterium phage Kalpine]|nr:hypothetical protein PBI_KALPINE_81 [Mycobacterium phage Kalpine]